MLRTTFLQTCILNNHGCPSCRKFFTRSMKTSLGAQSREKQTTNTTIVQSEVDIHTNLKDSWWNEYGPMKALHSMNLLRVPFVRDGLVKNCPQNRTTSTPLQGFRIMDVGCGGGILSEALARLGAQVTGIDASCELIELAKEHSCRNQKLGFNLPKYICTTAEEHAENHKEYYDGVVASEIIEHVHNKDLFIRSCTQVLKPGGRIFFTTPTRTKMAQFFAIYLAENVLRIVPKGTHHYDMLTTPAELSFMLDRSGNCQVELIHGAFYNFVTNSWSFCDSQSLLFFLQAVKMAP